MKSGLRRIKLGELFLKAGLIDEGTLGKALAQQKISKKKLGEVLRDMGVVDDVEIANALSSQLRIPLRRLDSARLSSDTLDLIPGEIAEHYGVVPIEKTASGLRVAVADPLDFEAVDALQFITRMQVDVVISPRNDILKAIRNHYARKDSLPADGYGIDIPMEIIQHSDPPDEADRDLLNLAELPPVIRLVNSILADAIRMKASDVHIEPWKTKLLVRFRIDGIMQEAMRTDKHVHAPLVSRIKVLSGLDIAVRRKPQDGRAQVRFGQDAYDLRVSSLPTAYGEKVTIRILNPASARTGLDDLGLAGDDLENLLTAIQQPQGMVLVTGPTGSGKSSTLYACLNRLNTPDVNIVTVEDPVEYDIDGINQVQINPRAGITFASGLRSILRQDPDIVMVGEIRDPETAKIAFQAAQTGHLVLSTLHTNDAPSAVIRLLDLGVEDFQISSALVAVLAQRLVRQNHDYCKVVEDVDPAMLKRVLPAIGSEGRQVFWKGRGCDDCQQTGYNGRVGIFELMMLTPALRQHISRKVSAQQLRWIARKDGFNTLFEDGIRKALQGVTSLDEVFRVANPETITHVAGPSDYPSVPITVSPKSATELVDRRRCWEYRDGAETLRMGTGPPTVLIVDDAQITRKLLQKALAVNGCSVVEADNGKKGLRSALDTCPDLIVTDYKMPEMDGVTLIRELKSRPSTAHIPVIMLTSRDELESEIVVFDAGADDYITKPVNARRFLARVNRFLKIAPRVLAVDDSVETLKILRRVLEFQGFVVITAENGADALKLMQRCLPDIVVTDYRMPQMDGMALLRKLKSQPVTRHIPVILLTAKDDVNGEVAGLDAGADDYLTKPVNSKKLLARINRILNRMKQTALHLE